MKKQNSNNKLAFNKVAVTELNENQLNEINGGTSIDGGGDTCTGCCCVQTLLAVA
ncbi:class I lanthipeptide [Flavobacterium sp. MMS24-S5]|uniref:class I lanthipeptide n=1 Tax=Flavobacterium sp. MMS24-S5 TaxID=3416605 RepID=UPI003D08EF9E